MAQSKQDPKVGEYLDNLPIWQAELRELRRIALRCGLEEAFKWGKPCYTYHGENVAILYAFKAYCALGFFKGALLKDEAGLLAAPGEHSQAMRQFRFTDVAGILKAEPVMAAYIREAVEVEKAGLQIDFGEKEAPAIPPEFRAALEQDPTLQTAFEALTPGRKRAYALYFSAPRHAETRLARIEKYTQRIREGKGMRD